MSKFLDPLALLAGYTAVFMFPFLLPPSSSWAVLLVPLGCLFVPLVRGLLQPRRLSVLIAAASLAGILFSGLYLAALDMSTQLRYNVGFTDAVLYRRSMVYALSPYGLFGGVGLAALAVVASECGRLLRERWTARWLNPTDAA